MNFDFDDEQKMLREEANRFLKTYSPMAACRRVLETDDAHDAPLWKRMGDMGWMATTIPAEYGGLDAGHLALCVLAEEIGYALSPVPFSSSVYLATEALLLAASEEQKQRWLPRLAVGEAIGTFAYAEDVGFVDPARFSTRFANGRISGRKVAVADGVIADFMIVVASDDDGPMLCLVEAGEGASWQPAMTIDPSRPQGTLVLDNAPAQALTAGGPGGALLDTLLDRAAVPLAFEQIGGAQAALDMACDYARERYAFGRPIGSFQGIKHKLADIYSAIVVARSNAYFAAWSLAGDAATLPVAAATARAAATEAFWISARENVQVHGGLGYTWEYDCQFHYRRSKLLGTLIGSVLEWKERLVSGLEARHGGLATAGGEG